MPEGQHTRSHVPVHDSIAEVQYLERKLEHNPNSPLAVRLASHYLKAGRVDEAKAHCDRLVSLYPVYPTAHLILGKCFLAIDRYAEAKIAFRQVLAILPDCLTAQLFLKELVRLAPDELDRQSPIVEAQGSSRHVQKPAESSDLKTEQKAPPTDLPVFTAGFKDLELLAERLQHVERMAPDPNAMADAQPNLGELSQKAEIISETMAEIYASQGAYEEAIGIYRLLIEGKPELGEKFRARIRELREKK